jgi:hypothetical protein
VIYVGEMVSCHLLLARRIMEMDGHFSGEREREGHPYYNFRQLLLACLLTDCSSSTFILAVINIGYVFADDFVSSGILLFDPRRQQELHIYICFPWQREIKECISQGNGCVFWE